MTDEASKIAAAGERASIVAEAAKTCEYDPTDGSGCCCPACCPYCLDIVLEKLATAPPPAPKLVAEYETRDGAKAPRRLEVREVLGLDTRAKEWAAPSSSPAPSGRRHEDDEKTATRSPSPDVIPATRSPRSPRTGDSLDWQPIETAPKDGTDVIVGGSEGVEVAQWENKHLEQRESGVIVDAGYDAGFWGFSYYGGGPQPTHWMPLPPSPSSQE